jgi:hypothetical protein
MKEKSAMNFQRSLLRGISLTFVLLIMSACSILNPGQSTDANSTIPKPGHWEGINPVVSFDVTAEGKIVNIFMNVSYGGSTCSISSATIAIQPDHTFDLNLNSTETLSMGYVNGTFNETKVSGKYMIEMCGQSISFVPGEDKDRDWKAEWKNATVPAFTPIPVESTFKSIPDLPTISPTPAEFNITVPADKVWVDTGIDLKAGQTLNISASGRINTKGGEASSDILSPDGETDIAPCYTIDTDCLMPGVFWGTLIGRIGSGAPFKVGSQLEIPISGSGRLFLAVNDNTGYFTDNSGAFNAIISIR